MSDLPMVNLLPISLRVRRARVRAQRVWMPVNLALLAIFCGAFVGTESQQSAGDPVADQARMELEAQISGLDADIRDAERGVPDLAQRVAAADALSGNPDWGVVVQLLGRLAEGAIQFRVVEIHPAQASPDLTQAPTRGQARVGTENTVRLVASESFVLSVDAVSPDNVAVSDFILRLIDAGLFADVRLTSSRREIDRDGNESYRFRVTARIAPGLIMPDPDTLDSDMNGAGDGS